MHVLPLLNSDFLPHFFIQLNTGNCRNNSNLGNYECLPVLFPDWEEWAADFITCDGVTLSPEELAESIQWVQTLIFAMGKSITIGAFAYPTLLCGLVISRIARA